MGTKQYFYSGGYTMEVDWNDSTSGNVFTYQPILTATSSTAYGDDYVAITWNLTLDGSTVTSGSGQGTYNSQAHPGRGPVQMDSFAVRTVTMDYGTTHTLRLVETFSDLYGATSKRLTVDAVLTVPALTYDLPAAITGLSATRVDDSTTALAWTNNAVQPNAPYSGIIVQRQTNGGAWETIATASGDANGYTDTSTAANNAYSYRAQAVNDAGSSAFTAPSATVYTTPATPGTPTATKTGATEVTLTFTNSAQAATGFEVQSTTDGGSTWNAAGSGSGIVGSYIDTNAPAASAVAYRVRNVAGAMVSAWSAASNTLAVLAQPNPPSILTPINYVSPLGQAVRLTWRHNPTDGSAQTAYSLKYSKDGGSTWTTISKTTSANQYRDLNPAGLSSGDSILWQVRTWGLDATGSDWSSVGSVVFIAAPSVAITSPASDPYTLTSLPLSITWTYSDMTYVQASATATVTDSGGVVVYTLEQQGTATTLTLDGWQPDNMASYSVALAVKSSSTLVVNDGFDVNVSYVAPAVPSLSIVETDGKAYSITVNEGTPTGSELQTDSLALYRVTSSGVVLLAESLHDGDVVTDYLPPMDVDFVYRLLALSSAMLSSKYEATAHLASRGFVVFNTGGGWSAPHVVPYNVKVSDEFTRDGMMFYPAGATSPVYLGGTQRGRTWKVSGAVIGSAVSAFREFADTWDGPLYFRAPGGIKAKAVATFSCEQSYTMKLDVSAELVRVV